MNSRTHMRLALKRLLGDCPPSIRPQKIDKALDQFRNHPTRKLSAYGYLRFVLTTKGTKGLGYSTLASNNTISAFADEVQVNKSVFPQSLLLAATYLRNLLLSVNDVAVALPYLQNMCRNAQLYILLSTKAPYLAQPYKQEASQLINSYPQIIDVLPAQFAQVCVPLLFDDQEVQDNDSTAER